MQHMLPMLCHINLCFLYVFLFCVRVFHISLHSVILSVESSTGCQQETGCLNRIIVVQTSDHKLGDKLSVCSGLKLFHESVNFVDEKNLHQRYQH